MNFKCLEGRCGYESGEERGRRAYVLMLYAALSAPPSLIGSVEWAAEDGGLEARGIPLPPPWVVTTSPPSARC
jgi:hypothetical protein